MRLCLAAVVALGLSGCTDVDLFRTETAKPAADQPVAQTAAPEGEAPAASEQSQAPQTSPVSTPSSIRESCTHLAKLRAGDAKFQGEDSDTQAAVHDRTYADCIAWDARHHS